MVKVLSQKVSAPPQELPNIPWEERPDGKNDVVWRYSKNPIIPRDLIPSSYSTFQRHVRWSFSLR
jgi:beta-1,4-mannooligosaccharide/beta-1,4-mannosyl-N-acetylglucosamine phosphorylase